MNTNPTPAALDAELRLRQERLASHFKPGFLPRKAAVFQFHFDDGAPFHLVIDGAELALAAGIHPQPVVNLYIDSHVTCWGLIEGELDGMEAFMNGQYRADGNIVLSQLLLYMFRRKDAALAYEVQD
jgi:putative sterol carrier protein